MSSLKPLARAHGSPFLAVAASLLRTCRGNKHAQIGEYVLVPGPSSLGPELREALASQRLDERNGEPRFYGRLGVLERPRSTGGVGRPPQFCRLLRMARRGGIPAQRGQAFG